MIRRTPRSTLTYTLVPYTTLLRSRDRCGENLCPSSCRHLLRWRCKLERRLALFMGADWPLQVSWLLEFRAFALGTGELVTKRLEFGPARLLIAKIGRAHV